jgi:coenzyme F420-reducing hydrogenase delta subunit
LEEIGLNGRRIQMLNVSSAMGGQFAFAAAEMTAEIKGIGPNPLRENREEKGEERREEE